jgi:hypothetical protein
MWRFRTGLLLTALVPLGCFSMADPQSGKTDRSDTQPAPRPQFAEDRAPAPGPAGPFDAKRAMGYLEDVCKIGSRISGTEGMKKQQELLTKHFEALGGKVALQTFTATQKSKPKQPVEMANLIVSWYPDRERRVLLCSHYDTRPIADQERDRRDWYKPFLSANDGGSGVALLMELAHHMKDRKTNVGVDFVFFDGEEYIFEPERDKYFFGSEHFAEQYRKDKAKAGTYVAAVLFDMIGGKNARFPVEGHTWQLLKAQALAKEIWEIAHEQKCAAFVAEVGTAVEDDHLALNRAGIPAVDVIDFSYAHWHRLSDVPENCSGESLEQVARVMNVWLQHVK